MDAPELRRALAQHLGDGGPFAVRSCAAIEDGASRSFAGQFESVLDVRGLDATVDAVARVASSADSDRVRAYGGAAATREIAVLVQRFVTPVASGVAFSRNPLTGLSEVIIEAVPGSGESLVQEGVTPDRWVDKWGAWLEKPQQGVLTDEVAAQVAAQVRAVDGAFGRPVDLEWVYDGHGLHWVQLRPMTAAGVPVYSNRISREVLPGAIKPLVWTINIPTVNGAWIRLLEELVGPTGLRPEDLARRFHHRAYFDMGAMGRIFEILGLPRDSLERLMGVTVTGGQRPRFRPSLRTLVHLPRMLRFAIGKLSFGRGFPRWLARTRAGFDALRPLNGDAPLRSIDALMALSSEVAYHNIVVPLLMQIYDRLLHRSLVRCGIDPDRLDLTRGLVALREQDPNRHLDALAQTFRGLEPSVQKSLLAAPAGGLREIEPHFADLVDAFLERFGHFSDSGNDLSSVPWRETPERIVKMVAAHPAREPADARVAFDELRIPALRRPMVTWLYRRARAFRLHREQLSSLYTLGYGLMRDPVLAMGKQLAEEGRLEHPDDIFYLELWELRGELAPDLAQRAAARRTDLERTRNLPLPELIFGDQPPPQAPPSKRDVLTGTAASRGYHEGPARVVAGIDELDRIQTGDVLVVPYSDVGWTPLFVRAGAIVAESGGLLSHSAIVAREYGIPAVVSVSGACGLPDGTRIAVDGYAGTVNLLEGD
jgi:pyruvate,water dikinase